MLKDSQLGKDMWAEAISTHVYIRNRCPTSILPNHITPHERVYGHPPSIGHLRVFGSKCFIKVPDENRSKLDDKASECRLIGFEGDSIYLVVNSNRKRMRSRNVIFMEGTANRSSNEDQSSPDFLRPEHAYAGQESRQNESASIEEMPDYTGEESKRRRTKSEVWGTDPSRRSERITNQGANEKVLVTKTTSDTLEIKLPKTYHEAIASPDGKLWKDAMDYELAKLEEMSTWSEINETDVPSGAQVLPGMWVHLIKNLESGDKKFRSRWVVRGDQQKTNISLSDTFAPVSRISSLRILMALAALKDLHIFAWDVYSAYLHGNLDHNIYIALPDGYRKPEKVGKLNKALYGLPEVVHIWHEDLEDKLKTLGFALLGSDLGVFLCKSDTGI